MIITSAGPSARRRAVAGLATLVVAGGLLTTLGGATPAGAEPGDVVVAENFDSGTLPAGWRAIDGDWKVVDGRLVGTATSGTRKITFGRHLEHFRFSATVRFEKVNEATRWTALGLDVPASGATPWWIATMRSGSTAANGLEFAQLTPSGSWNVTNTTAAPYAAGTGRDVKVAIEVHGNQARWFLDGRQLMRTSSLQRSTDGGQALVVNGATVSFDDVTVTELAPNGLLRPEGAPLTVIAHRGASAAAPENTLAAQEVARRAGSDWVENDVQPSRDGVPFVLHDGTVDRTTDGTGAIRNLTSAQLKALDAGSWFAPHFTGARLPTLAEQLADLRNRGGNLLLEIKGAHTRDEVARIVEVVRAERMTTRVFVQSFDEAHLRYVRELAPELPLGLLRSTLDADPVALAKELGLAAYNPSDAALTARPSVVADLRAAGVAVMVWTVDSATAWQRLEGYGVDGIITNRPAELAGWNAAQLQGGVGRPTVTVSSPADGARLDRAQRPVLGVVTGNADTVTVTLDGEPATPGQVLDASRLAAGAHTVRVEATGPGGRTTVTSTFTVVADPTGLAHLVLSPEVAPGARNAMLTFLGGGRYAQLAGYAEQHAGKQVPKDVATLIAADARALAAG
ncbi:glycerophosphodiester phosphodiesterase [Micromonospora echinospora]|uniref:Glycerophosphoryl diester phosphodiesterase n=1 Tax=Micromonospora echinospora TaxID=1877 RepID=A0A1C4Y1H7_MICEC|nr:glycerophosphodiester phosphodiesterase family protein [Micromonospora echinospora]OZV84386.1 glycerophosphodiester phosphodiesterase [Micromonospora echinospora]SCF14574.1 glycerophosphoryl diester phosphodiesterase [Micromonospora echinospora]